MTTPYLTILAGELRRKKAANPRYSLHAFSRDTGIAATRLSQILRGRQGLSAQSARKVAERLKLSPRQAQAFTLSVEAQHSRSRVEREKARQQASALQAAHREIETMPATELEALSAWAYLAVLEGFHIAKLPKSVEGFSRFFGMDEKTTRQVLELLVRQGRILRRGNHYRLRLTRLGTTQDVPSFPLRNFAREMLQRAITSLESQQVEERDISTLTFAFPKKLLPEAKQRLIAFRREFNAWAEHQITLAENPPDQVLCLTLALFRLGPSSTGADS
jgi:uncharacterized protein (TIGR02147 family)